MGSTTSSDEGFTEGLQGPQVAIHGVSVISLSVAVIQFLIRCDAASQALHSGLFEVAKLLLQAHPCHVIEETAESLLRLQ